MTLERKRVKAFKNKVGVNEKVSKQIIKDLFGAQGLIETNTLSTLHLDASCRQLVRPRLLIPCVNEKSVDVPAVILTDHKHNIPYKITTRFISRFTNCLSPLNTVSHRKLHCFRGNGLYPFFFW